jgi:hypothetical protein
VVILPFSVSTDAVSQTFLDATRPTKRNKPTPIAGVAPVATPCSPYFETA